MYPHVIVERFYGDGPEDPESCRRLSVRTAHVTISFILVSKENLASEASIRIAAAAKEAEKVVENIIAGAENYESWL